MTFLSKHPNLPYQMPNYFIDGHQVNLETLWQVYLPDLSYSSYFLIKMLLLCFYLDFSHCLNPNKSFSEFMEHDLVSSITLNSSFPNQSLFRFLTFPSMVGTLINILNLRSYSIANLTLLMNRWGTISALNFYGSYLLDRAPFFLKE